MKTISVGTLESSDCLITLKSAQTLSIDIDSVVHEAFYDHIKAVVEKTLAQYNIEKIQVIVQDKGALDYTIIARLKSAIERWREAHG